MSIDRTQPLKPTSSLQPRDSHDTATVRSRQVENRTATADARVVLGSALSPLTTPGAQDINRARVEQLKTAIRNGELKTDSGRIADVLIQASRSSLQDV